jgi:hypothetical protein
VTDPAAVPPPSASRAPWTSAMTAFFVRMRRRGKPYWWIAKALGVTRATLLGRAVKMGLVVRAVVRRRMTSTPATGEPDAIGPVREIVGQGLCHWISGDTADRDWRMCGHPAARGASWCAHHYARVYDTAPAPAGDEGAADDRRAA